jgi:hypothetical protein
LDLKWRAAIIGVGGTIAWFALIYAVFFAGDRLHHPSVGFYVGLALLCPMLPGMMPGAGIGVVLALLGIPGFGDGGSFHSFGSGPANCAGLSALVINPVLVYLWLKRK